jgi:DNA-nicking Smr family endonuclease
MDPSTQTIVEKLDEYERTHVDGDVVVKDLLKMYGGDLELVWKAIEDAMKAEDEASFKDVKFRKDRKTNSPNTPDKSDIAWNDARRAQTMSRQLQNMAIADENAYIQQQLRLFADLENQEYTQRVYDADTEYWNSKNKQYTHEIKMDFHRMTRESVLALVDEQIPVLKSMYAPGGILIKFIVGQGHHNGQRVVLKPQLLNHLKTKYPDLKSYIPDSNPGHVHVRINGKMGLPAVTNGVGSSC